MDMRHIDFGRDTAEFDRHLSSYFLQTPAYERMMQGQKSIVIGRKGTGKTALVKYCHENQNTSRHYVVKIESSHSTYVRIDENLKSFVSQVKNLDSSFKMGWLFATLLALVERLAHEETMLVTREEHELHDFAKQNLSYDPSDPISAMAGYVMSWIKHLKKLGPIERASDADKPPILDEPRLLQLVISAVARINAKGKSVFLLYDKLDERWDGSPLYVSFLQGLFLAAKDLKASGCQIYPVIFLRDDIFDEVTRDFQHIDHYRMEIERIAWDEESLLTLAALRIKNSITQRGQRIEDSSSEGLWRLVFPEDVPHRGAPVPSHAYMIERTLLRPRDIILFATQAREAAVGSKHSHVTVDDMLSAEKAYSHMKLRDLVAECSYRFPRLDDVLQKFRRKTIGMSTDELRVVLMDVIDERSSDLAWLPPTEDDLIKLLYGIGFLAFTTRGGVLRGTRVVHSAIEPDPAVILEQERVFISPIFRRALDLRDH